MKSLGQVKQNVLLFLFSGILILCIGFVFISCGTGPMSKVKDSDKGSFAIDMSTATDLPSGLFIGNKTIPSLSGTEFTVEAWVKRKTSDLNGGIFSRLDNASGIAMWANTSEPKFAIRLTKLPTSTDYIASCGVTINPNEWTHVAGVLVDEDHSIVHQVCTDKCSTTTSTACAVDANCPAGETCVIDAETQTPHLDIYCNGGFKDCVSTESQFAQDDAVDGEGNRRIYIGMISLPGVSIDNPIEGFFGTNSTLTGVVDEIRFWTVARTQAQIQQCMNQKLEVTGPCKINPDILKGYWPLNEGTGKTFTDISGSGFGGSLQSPFGDNTEWDGAWTAGKF